MDILTGLTFVLALYGLYHIIYVVFRTIKSIQIRFRKFCKSNSPHSTDIETLAPAVRNEVEGRE